MYSKARRVIAMSIASCFLATCNGAGEDDSSGLLLLLLAGAAASANPVAGCIPQMETTESSFTGGINNANFYGTGRAGTVTNGVTVPTGPSSPSAIITAEYDHGFADRWVDFFYNHGGNIFLSRGAPLALTYGTGMYPYGTTSSHYISTAAPLSNSAETTLELRPVVPATGGTVRTVVTRSLVPASAEETAYVPDTVTADFSQRGRSHRWSTERPINIHLIFIAGSNANATESAFQTFRDRLTAIYTQDTVRVRPLFTSAVVNNPTLLDVSNLTDETGTLAGSLTNLFTATAAAQRADAVNVIVTREASALAGLLGVSGGLPGTPGRTGKRTSAVVLFTNAHQIAPGAPLSTADLEFLAGTGSHEIGHYLGLNHLVERTGYTSSVFERDALIETPECRSSSDANTNGIVEIGECSGTGATNSGGRNLMFWAGSPAITQEDMTGEQGWLIRRNPLVCPAN